MSLISEIRQDLDASALQLITEYRDRLFAEAVRLSADVSAAEDLVSRTLDKAIRNLESHHKDESVFGWMKTIMLNLQRNDMRSPVRRGTTPVDPSVLEEYSEADWKTDEEILKRSDSQALREAIGRLDPEFKKTMVLHYLSELPVKQIAIVMNVPVGTVLWRLNIARKILARDLADKIGRKPLAVLLAVLIGIGTLWGAWSAGWSGRIASWIAPKEAEMPERTAALDVDSTGRLQATVEKSNVTGAAAPPALERFKTSSTTHQTSQDKGDTMNALSKVASATIATMVIANGPVAAYAEGDVSHIVYVSPTGNDTTGDGSQGNPYQTIMKGVTAAKTDDVVALADGTYNEHNITISKKITVVSQSGNNTKVTVDAQKAGRAFILSAGATVSHLRIVNGSSSANGGNVSLTGGAILSDCIVTDGRTASSFGGNVWLEGGSRAIRCQILNGDATAAYWTSGGGIGIKDGIAESCLIKGNTSKHGGGAYLTGSAAILVNCTVVENEGTDLKSEVCHGLFCEEGAALYNTVIYNNLKHGTSEFYNKKNKCSFVCCASSQNIGKTDCVPMSEDAFFSYFKSDYGLVTGSPLIDVGMNQPNITGYSISALDLGGNARVAPADGTIDIGCYENQQTGDDIVVSRVTANPDAWTEGSTCRFAVTVNGGVAPYAYRWNFGDGTSTTINEATCEHVYGAGFFEPKVTVVDANGAEAEYSGVIRLPFAPSVPMYVDVNCTEPLPPYTNLAHAATSVDDALRLLSGVGRTTVTGGIIYIADGLYNETGSNPDSRSRLDVRSAVKIIGLSGDPTKVTIRNNNAANGFRVLWMAHADAVLANVTVSDGWLTKNDGEASGGGNVHLSNGTITNCVLYYGKNHRNSTSACGGNLFIEDGLVVDSLLDKGGINESSSAESEVSGGNVYMTGGRVTRCRITNGHACRWTTNTLGNNVYARGGQMDSCLITGGRDGQYTVYLKGTAHLINCTIAGNGAAYNATGHDGVYVAEATARLTNCLIGGNNGRWEAFNNWSEVNGGSFVNCAAQTSIVGGTDCVLIPGENEWTDQFSDVVNFIPHKKSVVIDAGLNYLSAQSDYGLDLLGNPRKCVRLDIGAYEALIRGLVIMLY